MQTRVQRTKHPILRFVGALATLLAGLLCPAGDPAGPRADVYTRFDFETPGYGGWWRSMSDHFLLKQGGVWHLFYTELLGPSLPDTKIGHVTSTDLVHWTDRADVLVAGFPLWMATGVWAPHVLPKPGGGWIMLFTGRNEVGAQYTGAATSLDLDTWQLVPENPIFTPPTTIYRWGPTFASSCRDPFIYSDAGTYYMLYTAVLLDGRPAIGRASSSDLIHWNEVGPFVVDSSDPPGADLESPTLIYDNGRAELIYTQTYLKMATAASLAGPFDVEQAVTLDAFAAGAEKVRDGSIQLLSRVRYDVCSQPTSVIVVDTVTANPGGYVIPPAPLLPPGWTLVNDAFSNDPTYGDGPAFRGSPPASPGGMRWLASGEQRRMPGGLEPCVVQEAHSRVGAARSAPFVLQGDALHFRIMGANSIDSAYVSLIDDCTGLEIQRGTGPGTTVLTERVWPNTARRGLSVRLGLTDYLTRPGGVIGLDTVRDSANGSPAPAVQPAVNQTMPVGGENLSSGSVYTVRWTSFHAAGMDSHVVYLSYDDFQTPPQRLQKRTGNQFSWGWTVPQGPLFNARIRVVGYAKNGVHACDSSPAFTIGVTVDAPSDPTAGLRPGLRLAASGSPGRSPTLEWEAPPGLPARLRLFDVRGRFVRELDRAPGGTVRRATWDGRDEAGRAVPGGLYFAVLEADGQKRSVRLVRVLP